MKSYYSEFAAHALRCWARGYAPRNEAEALANQGVIRALDTVSDAEFLAAKWLYGIKKPFNMAITDYAVLHSVPEGQLWDMVRRLERRVAKECGII